MKMKITFEFSFIHCLMLHGKALLVLHHVARLLSQFDDF